MAEGVAAFHRSQVHLVVQDKSILRSPFLHSILHILVEASLQAYACVDSRCTTSCTCPLPHPFTMLKRPLYVGLLPKRCCISCTPPSCTFYLGTRPSRPSFGASDPQVRHAARIPLKP